ncbi:MAG: hypothetical protein CSB33_02365 [Desulfobacterales bacterium]|nr:MAG: hypothetical protein CSB33_02365 [Desulfobacterales bacterium]
MIPKSSSPKKGKSGGSDRHLLNIGFNCLLAPDRIVAVVPPNSAPMKRIKDEAREDHRLVDTTHGRKTRSMVIVDSNHLFLSSIHVDTLAHRLDALLREDCGED